MMRVIVTTDNHSLTEENILYARDVVHEVSDTLGARLIKTGRMGPAATAPPDPLSDEKERAAELLGRMAAMPGLLDKIERMMGAATDDVVADLTEAAEADEPVVVTNAEPREVAPLDDDLEDMTVHQLRAMAKDREVEISAKYMRKADIIAALRGD